MKSKILLVASLLCAALFLGCASSAKLNDLRIGMTKDQVIALLGTPDSTSAEANSEYMTYYLVANSGEGRDQPYMVRLVDGKVESFGRFAQLYDLYNRPVTNARPGDPNFPQANVLGSTTVVAAPAAGGSDIAGQLQKLKELKDQGVLTDDEFQKAKDKLLNSQK